MWQAKQRPVAPVSVQRLRDAVPAVPVPVERCAWCWYVLHPTCPYPLSWSSMCCAAHASWLRRKRGQL